MICVRNKKPQNQNFKTTAMQHEYPIKNIFKNIFKKYLRITLHTCWYNVLFRSFIKTFCIMFVSPYVLAMVKQRKKNLREIQHNKKKPHILTE